MRFGRACILVVLAGALSPARADQPDLRQWTSPPFWLPETPPRPGDDSSPSRARIAESKRTALGVPSALPFFALSPCRLVDTRGNGAPLGGGFLAAATVRSYTLVGTCGIPAGAQAVSLNATAVDPSGAGFLVLWEKGQPFPPVSTLVFKTLETVSNAAVVPLSPDGSISVAFGVSGADLVLDTNGYYAAEPGVTSLNTLTGDVTIVPGANVTVVQGANALTISATGGPGGQLPSGAAGQTLRSNGTSWIPNDALTSDGSNVSIPGRVDLSPSPRVTAAGLDFLHADGSNGNVCLGLYSLPVGASGGSNTALGASALTYATTGHDNAGLGWGALNANVTGIGNTAVGSTSLLANTSGGFNTAVGYFSLRSSTSASFNTAVGHAALVLSTTGASNVAVGASSLFSDTIGSVNTSLGNESLYNNLNGSGNVAVGASALFRNTTGSSNAAVGLSALGQLNSGDFNLAIGYAAGFNILSGSNNILLSSQGLAGDNGAIRIGTPGTQSLAFIAGIRGTTTTLNDALPIVIDSAGQLGTVSSSARAKDEIRDMAEESDRLMRLRPVTFRFKGQASDGPRQFGLIAEEVDEVLPELVVRNRAGEIETVKYHELPAMLLNELQKMARRAEAAEDALRALERRLAKLEAAATARVSAGRQLRWPEALYSSALVVRSWYAGDAGAVRRETGRS